MSNKTIKEVLNNYKYSLDNWMSRCDNNTPPANQKGLVIAEIDTETLSDIQQILEEEKKKAVKEFADGILAKQKTYSYVKMSPGIFKFDTNKIIDAVPVSAITERLGK